MKKPTQFDKASLKTLREEMQAVLDKFGDKTGLAIRVGNINYTMTEADIKIKVNIVGAQTRASLEVKKLGVLMGFTDDLSGTNGRRLIGYQSRNRKYPFIYELNGKQYKCTEAQAKAYFTKAA